MNKLFAVLACRGGLLVPGLLVLGLLVLGLSVPALVEIYKENAHLRVGA